MLNFEPNVVFIDDKENEVLDIIDLYRDKGVGVKFFNAHLDNPTPAPEDHYSDVNLIFLDLHYREDLQAFDAEVCTGKVEDIIPKNSFYVLVIWSRDIDKAEEVLSDLRSQDLAPYHYLIKDKNDYRISGSYDFNKLFQEIELDIKERIELEEVAQWKKSIKESSNLIIGHLANGVESPDLINKLKKIILGHGGTYLIGDGRIVEKRNILFDALDNILISNSKSTRPKLSIPKPKANSIYSIPNSLVTNIDKKLNSWFHFNVHNYLSEDLIMPGLLCTYTNNNISQDFSTLSESELIRANSLIDDERISAFLSEQTTNDTSCPEFINICVLLSRPCDIAQKKYGKNLKLLSGILVINPVRKSHKFKAKMRIYDSMKILDHIYFSESIQDAAIIFDYRYIFSVPDNIFKEKFKNVKLFNKELISEIQVDYSSYSNRLGITQII